ncbi:MAG: TIGR03663 family protein [Dehalococcoidia bacterium]|nr:TIGR03663 family protein [Dehalococcoidia bacterium]
MTGDESKISSEYAPSPAVAAAAMSHGTWVDGRWVESVPAVLDQRPDWDRYEGAGPSPFRTDSPEPPPTGGGGWRHDLPFRWEAGAYVSLFLVALAMRLYDLGGRAVHHDESLHGYFSWQLFNGNGYAHDPLMHGPFLFHITAGSFFLFGDNDFTLRLAPALFGTALVLTPLLLRNRLGNVSALIVAGMLAFSPSLLYFSRFARNDIFVALWTIALVAMVWRYMDDRRPRYVYLTAALVSLGFATKETQYIVVALVAIPLLVIARGDVLEWVWGRRILSEWGPAGGMLVVIVTLTLPMIGAVSGLIQDALGVTLANDDSSTGLPFGVASGTGEVVAVAITAFLVATSFVVGMLWNRRVWLTGFGIAAGIFVVLFSTVFTNWPGLASGVWQGLGYWVAQQEIARGSQPDFYYVMLTSVYEFLPATIGLVGAVYYAFKGDAFTRFLAYWPLATFAAYSAAGEKMPWLEVQVALPFIVLGGKVLGDLVTSLNWRPSMARGGGFVFAGVPIAVIVLWRLIFLGSTPYGRTQPGLGGLDEAAGAVVLFGVLGLLVAGLFWLTRRIGSRQAYGLVGVGVVGLLAVLTIRTGWIATYQDPDVPTELLVYTQTSPALADIAREIDAAADLTGEGADLKVTVDGLSGFSWPWTWYLRDYAVTNNYSNLAYTRPDGPSDSSVFIVHTGNESIAKPAIETGFTEGRRFPHRQWFAESYKQTTWRQFFDTLVRPSRWQNNLNFFLYREVSDPIGSEDGFVYFNRNLPLRALE